MCTINEDCKTISWYVYSTNKRKFSNRINKHYYFFYFVYLLFSQYQQKAESKTKNVTFITLHHIEVTVQKSVILTSAQVGCTQSNCLRPAQHITHITTVHSSQDDMTNHDRKQKIGMCTKLSTLCRFIVNDESSSSCYHV